MNMQFKITLATDTSYTYEGTTDSLFKHIKHNTEMGVDIKEWRQIEEGE